MVTRRPQHSRCVSSPLPARERLVRVVVQRALFSARFKVLFLSFAFSACARVSPPAPRAVLVNIPIATPIYCDVPALSPPPLAIASLTAESPPADTIRDYAATVDVLKSAVRERDAILKGCGAPEEPKSNPVPKNPVPLPTMGRG
jgi:hypothetical protein